MHTPHSWVRFQCNCKIKQQKQLSRKNQNKKEEQAVSEANQLLEVINSILELSNENIVFYPNQNKQSELNLIKIRKYANLLKQLLNLGKEK